MHVFFGNGRDGNFLSYRFIIDGEEIPCTIKGYEITGYVPYGYPRNKLTAHFEITDKIRITVDDVKQVSGETVNNFTNPVIYRLTDVKDDSFVEYTVTIKNRPPNGVIPKVTSYSILLDGKEYQCHINEEAKTITGLVPYGTDRSALVATFQTTEHPNVSIDGIPLINKVSKIDFTSSRMLLLKDYEDEYNEYTVTISIAPNDEALVYSLSLEIDKQSYVAQVNTDTIIARLPYGTPLNSVSFTYVVSDNAQFTIDGSPIVNTDTVDLSDDKIIKIIAESGIEKNYTLIVQYEKHTQAEITSLLLPTTDAIYNCDIADRHIETSVTYGTVLTNIIPTFTVSHGAQVYDKDGNEIISGETPVTFVAGEITYFTVVSEDRSLSHDYTVLIVNTDFIFPVFTEVDFPLFSKNF